MGITQNLGFMWERKAANWGQPGKGGKATFEGVKVGNKKRVVDFRGQMGIYVLYDRFENPVQVGQAKHIFGRLWQHQRDHLRNRWAYFTWFGFFKVGANNQLLMKDQAAELKRMTNLGDALDEIEAVLIQVMDPRLNRQGPRWKDAEEFLQCVVASSDYAEDEANNGES